MSLIQFFCSILEKLSFKNVKSFNFFLNQIFNIDSIKTKLKMKGDLNFTSIAVYFSKVLYEYIDGEKGASLDLFREYIKLLKQITNFSIEEVSNSIDGKKICAILHSILCEYTIIQAVYYKSTIECLLVRI